MARPSGSKFTTHLSVLKEQNIAAYCWGFVLGKTQTIYPWDSWTTAYESEPAVWFHDIFRADGTPFDLEEIAAIKRATAKTQGFAKVQAEKLE